MKLRMPTPPSTNALFIQRGRRRVKSPAYKAWQHSASGWVQWDKIKGPVVVDIAIPENRRRDIDNYAKPILDLLVKSRVIEDDRCAILRALSLRWHSEKMVEVTVEPAPLEAV